ncbi:cation:proton antiporter [Agreia sp.]|uniref:cation:proton antiporter n=1 Tax=Agreia sp. TaxID=1872416 RepID=UPI0035BC8E73
MELALIAVLGVVVIVAVSLLAPKVKLAAPLILAVLGIGISLLPGVPSVHVASAVILSGVLPPLLYASSISLPLVDLRSNIGSISALAVVLVIASAFGTGWLLFTLFPELNLAAAIALGAVISPTDAVAATSIGKRLGLPPRLLAVLEGESLVNDASALVLLRTAIAATAGAVSAWQVLGMFAYSVVLGVGLGVAIGYLTVFVRARVPDPVLATAISFVVPFAAYLPAESIGASGVLSVVAAGLITGHLGATSFSAPARLSERLNWRTFQFLLENGVFLLMGLELKTIVEVVRHDRFDVPQAILFGLLATAVLIAIRFAVVAVMTAFSRRPRARPDPEALGAREGVVLSWSGMRGVVAVAAAQSLPETIFHREQLVLIAYTVAIVTLVVQGATLPAVIRLTGVKGTPRERQRQEFAELIDHIRLRGVERLNDPTIADAVDGVLDPAVIERVRIESARRSEYAWEQSATSRGHAPAVNEQYALVRRDVLLHERAALVAARNRGSYSSTALARAQEMLDLEEASLDHLRDGDGAGH